VKAAMEMLGLSRSSYYRRVRGMTDYQAHRRAAPSTQHIDVLREVALKRVEAGHRRVRYYHCCLLPLDNLDVWFCSGLQRRGASVGAFFIKLGHLASVTGHRSRDPHISTDGLRWLISLTRAFRKSRSFPFRSSSDGP
jgi:hypothetical protein